LYFIFIFFPTVLPHQKGVQDALVNDSSVQESEKQRHPLAAIAHKVDGKPRNL
jgi:hypothetical protein